MFNFNILNEIWLQLGRKLEYTEILGGGELHAAPQPEVIHPCFLLTCLPRKAVFLGIPQFLNPFCSLVFVPSTVLLTIAKTVNWTTTSLLTHLRGGGWKQRLAFQDCCKGVLNCRSTGVQSSALVGKRLNLTYWDKLSEIKYASYSFKHAMLFGKFLFPWNVGLL